MPSFRHSCRALLVVLLIMAGLSFRALAAEVSFQYTLDAPVVTSAGVYDAQGKLVRVLWTLTDQPAGQHDAKWDGLDAFGQPTPAGAYSWRVACNSGSAINVGAIGNSGLPPSAAGHTPANIESVAVDKDGNIYTANGWDEAGADFKKWDKDGHSLFDAKFEIRNGKPNGAPYSIAVDDQYIYCGVGGWEHEPWNNRQQIQRFRASDGKPAPFTGTHLMDGHINVYEWPARQIPPATPPEDAELMKAPLRAIAIHGDTIYVADALGGKIRKYNKETGDPEGDFAVPLPSAVAVDPAGKWIWVITRHGWLRALSAADGVDGGSGIQIDPETVSLCFGPDGVLYAAGQVNGEVTTIKVEGGVPHAIHLNALGQKAVPGDRAPDHFFRLTGVAVGPDGSLVTITKDPPGGARLARWSLDGKLAASPFKLLWETFGTEFVSLGNYGERDPDAFYSMSFKKYALGDRNAGKWDYAANAFDGQSAYRSDPHGAVRVLHLGDHDFVFLPMGDGVQCYRVDGNVMRLAALLGGRDPGPGGKPPRGSKEKLGQWTWADTKGTYAPADNEIRWFKQPGLAKYTCFGMDVDAAGNIVFANSTTHSIWMIPLQKLNDRGNPVYDWADAREIIPRDHSPLGFEPTMAQRAADGSVYAFGWSKPWPSPKNNPFWMGGTTLVRFNDRGELLWAVPLPAVCVGLDVIPPGKDGQGGCMVGQGRAAQIDQYTADGLLIGQMKPGDAMSQETGWMDNHASVAVNRDPRDGVLDVFAEDDYVCRIGWYRVEDGKVRVVSGAMELR